MAEIKVKHLVFGNVLGPVCDVNPGKSRFCLLDPVAMLTVPGGAFEPGFMVSPLA